MQDKAFIVGVLQFVHIIMAAFLVPLSCSAQFQLDVSCRNEIVTANVTNSSLSDISKPLSSPFADMFPFQQ